MTDINEIVTIGFENSEDVLDQIHDRIYSISRADISYIVYSMVNGEIKTNLIDHLWNSLDHLWWEINVKRPVRNPRSRKHDR